MSRNDHVRVPPFGPRSRELSELFLWISFPAALLSCGIFIGICIEKSGSCQNPAIHAARTP